MDVRICDKCDKFRCRLGRSVTCVDNRNINVANYFIVNYLIVVECDGNAVAVETIGNAFATKTAFSFSDLGFIDISVESLPDDVRQDYDNAVERIIAKLEEVECLVECKYQAEQLVFELNQ